MVSAYTVTRDTLDSTAGIAIVNLREAFVLIKRMAEVLAAIPSTAEADDLVAEYGYDTDQAYRLRIVFETLNAKADDSKAIMEIAKALTGLQ